MSSTRLRLTRIALLLGLFGVLLTPPLARAALLEGVAVDDTVQVAGRRLQLHGAGISRSWLVRVYAIALYLPERSASLAEARQTEGPRRIAIALMRDVSADDFRAAITDQLSCDEPGVDRAALQGPARQLVQAVGRRPQGLHKGDLLTLDWVPGTGTVVELNHQPLIDPVRGRAFYDALLAAWLGEQVTDTTLRAQLLGAPSSQRVVSRN